MTTPQRIGRYQVLKSAGTGGFATVYRAQDPQLDRALPSRSPIPIWPVNPSTWNAACGKPDWPPQSTIPTSPSMRWGKKAIPTS